MKVTIQPPRPTVDDISHEIALIPSFIIPSTPRYAKKNKEQSQVTFDLRATLVPAPLS